MELSDFDFRLPDELIAQDPPAERGTSRLMVVPLDGTAIEHRKFSQLPDHLERGDLLVVNNSRVFPARLLGRRVPSGGSVECLLLRRLPETNSAVASVGPAETLIPAGTSQLWEALVHPGQKLKPGARMTFESGTARLHGEIQSMHFHGRRTVRLWTDDGADVWSAIEATGHVPLPPYIKRDDRASDRDRYQTVYARARGSIAAPTAGLHFTPELLQTLSDRGVERTEVTLHVGYGTFKPIRSSTVEEHVVDGETFEVTAGAAAALQRARTEGRRIVAVGTTTVRVLESLPPDYGQGGVRGTTDLFIRPGHSFRLVDAMITNFHLPRSSLLVLVSAFAGRERVLDAYREAVRQHYRFYSYGDAMLIA